MQTDYLSEPAIFHKNLIFHFTNPDAALNIIKTLKFKAGRLITTNDVRENLLYQQFQFIDSKMMEVLKYQCFTFSFSSNYQRADSDILFYGYRKPRMWAQYANNSSGICLVIDKSLFLKAIGKLSSKYDYCFDDNIAYEEKLPDFTTSRHVKNDVATYQKDLFFTKHLDWRDENEYRVVIISHEEQFNVGINLEGTNCFVKGLIMGPLFPYKAELIYRLNKSGLMEKICLYNSTAKYEGVNILHWPKDIAINYISSIL